MRYEYIQHTNAKPDARRALTVQKINLLSQLLRYHHILDSALIKLQYSE